MGQLVTQRKGLVAAGLQVLGIDQRYRLGSIATTQALEQQNAVTRALGQARAAAGNAARGVVSGNIGSIEYNMLL